MGSKMIYLAKRNPSTTHAQFLENWKQHSALAGGFPRLRERFLQVAQCSRIQDDSLLPDATRDYDGVNLLTMRSLVDALEVWDDPDTIATMLKDELRVFSTNVQNFTVYAHDAVLIDGPMRGTVLVHFLARPTGTTRETFIKRWTGTQARALMAVPTFQKHVRRFVHNHVVLDPPPGYEYDGVAEIWLDRPEDARALFVDAEFRREYLDADFYDSARSVLMFCRVNLARPPIDANA